MNDPFNAFSKLLLASILLGTLTHGQAKTDATTFTVSAAVSANCSISATAVDFGAYAPVGGGNVVASGSVIVACTKGATGLTVGLSNGSNYGAGTRNLMGAVRGDKLAYSLRQPLSATPDSSCPGFAAGTEWSTTTPLVLTSPSGKAARTYKVCGQLAADQDVSVDNYADTVTATINF